MNSERAGRRQLRFAATACLAATLTTGCAYHQYEGDGQRLYRSDPFFYDRYYDDFFLRHPRYHYDGRSPNPRRNSDYRRRPPRRDRPSIRDRD